MSNSHTTFKIHPSIGIARLGNTDDNFYLCPEQPGALPIECDDMGKEIIENGVPKRVTKFKNDANNSQIKKQAARFRIYAYADGDTDGEEIKKGGTYDFLFEDSTSGIVSVKGTVTDIDWTVHLANKKASWYEFQETAGMHGYSSSHALRNAEVTQPDLRRQLIIDPGPLTVNLDNATGSFAKFGSEPKKGDKSKFKKVAYPQTFPPADIQPNPIETLGSLKVNEQDKHIRLIVLGGDGNSGSTKTPVITSFVNNDGWFDDISDGPVTASIAYSFEQIYYDGDEEKTKTLSSTMDVQIPAWVVVGYPRYAPEIEDMITMDEKMYDLFVRKFAYNPEVFGVAPYDAASNSPSNDEEWGVWRTEADYNPDYYPKFYEEIWPMLERPNNYTFTLGFDGFDGADPHNRSTSGNLNETTLSQAPSGGKDPNCRYRQMVLAIMRDTKQLNEYVVSSDMWPTSSKPRLMPMLCGNNPLSNTSPEKFLSMTETQLFFLKQWAKGKFVNECTEWKDGDPNCKNPWANPPTTGIGIDRGVLSNVLGGAFCPGGELSWIVDNPAIYSEAYRIKHATYEAGGLSIPEIVAVKDGSDGANLSTGMEPGDLTKYIGIPWQADFHECTYQDIDVTYDGWSNLYLDSTGDPAQQVIANNIPWWPAHRPMVVQSKKSGTVYWSSGIPNNKAGDLQMVQAWNELGFLKASGAGADGVGSGYYQQERNEKALGPEVAPGDRIMGQTFGKTNQDS
jgi:hypothetical protein